MQCILVRNRCVVRSRDRIENAVRRCKNKDVIIGKMSSVKDK